MKNLRIKMLSKYFLYALLCVCIFVGVWALIGFMLYDFNYLNTEGTRPAAVIQFLVCSFFCVIAIRMIED